MSHQTVAGIFSLVTALITIAHFIDHPIDMEAIKRTLSTVRDTLAKETTLDLISYSGAIVGCGYIVWVIVRDWV